MSCSSRAMRVRSSSTARIACSAAATSASTARRVDSRARFSQVRSPAPAPQTRTVTVQWKAISPGACSCGTVRSMSSSVPAATPAAAQRSRPRPYRAAMNTPTSRGTIWP